MRLCVVVPCYNEEKRLKVNDFNTFIEANSIDFLFVNDGSNDNTQNVLEQLRFKNPNKVSIHSMDQNSGKAEAIRTGINLVSVNSNYDFVGFFDSDLATPLYELSNMKSWLEDHADIVMIMGIRIKRLGSKVDRQLSRHYLGRVFATFVSLILGLPTYDTQCGAKIINASLAKEICKKPFQSAWFFDVEIILRIKQLKGEQYTLKHIYEYPLFEWKEIEGSNIKPKHYFMAPFELLKIKLRS